MRDDREDDAACDEDMSTSSASPEPLPCPPSPSFAAVTGIRHRLGSNAASVFERVGRVIADTYHAATATHPRANTSRRVSPARGLDLAAVSARSYCRLSPVRRALDSRRLEQSTDRVLKLHVFYSILPLVYGGPSM